MSDLHVAAGKAMVDSGFRSTMYGYRRVNQLGEAVRRSDSVLSLYNYLVSSSEVRLDNNNIVKFNRILFSRECVLLNTGTLGLVRVFGPGGLAERAGKEITAILADKGKSALSSERSFQEILGVLAFDHHSLTYLQERAHAGQKEDLWKQLEERTGLSLAQENNDVLVELVYSGAVYYLYRMDYFAWKIIDQGGVQCGDGAAGVVYENVVSRCSVSQPGSLQDETFFREASAQASEDRFKVRVEQLGRPNLGVFRAVLDEIEAPSEADVGGAQENSESVVEEDDGNWVATEWAVQQFVLDVEAAATDDAVARITREFTGKVKAYSQFEMTPSKERLLVPSIDVTDSFDLRRFILEVDPGELRFPAGPIGGVAGFEEFEIQLNNVRIEPF